MQVLFCFVIEYNGIFESLPWKDSLDIFKSRKRIVFIKDNMLIFCNFFNELTSGWTRSVYAKQNEVYPKQYEVSYL